MEVFVAKLSTLIQKQKMRVLAEGRPILLAYYDGKPYAIRDKCPHRGATLSNGIFQDGEITCKDHGLPISVVTGEVTSQQKADFLKLDEYSLSVRKYKTIVKDESVYVIL